MKRLSGVPASPGIAIGKALLYRESEFPEIKRLPIAPAGVAAELKRFETALEAAREELRLLDKKAGKEMNREQAGIFTAHLMMLEDPDFIDQIAGRIKKSLDNAEWAVFESGRALAETVSALPDPGLRERASDITDISKRVLSRLLSINPVSLTEIAEDVILAARDIPPSEILAASKEHVKGIAMDMGSRTSHTAIIARAFNIPAVVGLSAATGEIKRGDTLLVDGDGAQVFINPDGKTLEKYRKAETLRRKKLAEDASVKELPAETLDGHRVSLEANIGAPEEAESALKFGAEGVGVYRSEFLFLVSGSGGSAQGPGEDAQFEAYSRILKAMGRRPVTIRTVDLGGDKIFAALKGAEDENPLLGFRGIRFSLAQPELFKVQLRALLRSSANGNLKIMFPLISGIEELEKALALLEEAKAECRKKGRGFADNIETGIMIEVPSAALCAGTLAEKASFFSIGTNDLVQYALAVDRGNERVNNLAQPGHPAVLRLIKTSIDAAHKRGIKAAMCGEMAGDPFYAPLLLGLGIDEFSMASQAIPQVKKIIRAAGFEDCRALAAKIMEASSCRENTALLKAWAKDHLPAK